MTFTKGLLASSSLMALSIMSTSAAFAQPIEEVVVTGSHIRGIAPVGSVVASVGQEDFQKTTASSAYDLLLKVPQLTNIGLGESTNFGGTRSQGAAGNQYFLSSINLRGLNQQATLTLFNGQRVTQNGMANAVDPSIIPPGLIQRVDIQADGSSAIYGSDAIAGTVNFILRDPVDIVQTSGQVSFKKGNSTDWVASTVVGKTWDAAATGLGDGGIIIAYQHTRTAAVSADAMSYAFADDLTPYLGIAGRQSTFSSPGNVSGFGATTPAQAVLYPAPATGIGPTGQLTLGQLGSSATPNLMSAYVLADTVLPRVNRDAVAFNFKQDLASWLHFTAFGAYNTRGGASSYGTTPHPTATINVTSANPYSPCATAAAAASAGLPPPNPANSQGLVCPASGTVRVAYDFVYELGGQYRNFSQKNFRRTLWNRAVSTSIFPMSGRRFFRRASARIMAAPITVRA